MVEPVGIFIAITAGLLSFLSPCVLPLVPSYLSFVTGMTLDDLQEGGDRRAIMTHSILFVSGFTLVFLLLGASASFLGQFFRLYEVWLARVGGLVILVFGLHLMGVFRIAPLLRERRVHLSDKPAGHVGTLAVGAAFGAGWTPCIGPVLGSILFFAGMETTVSEGMLLLGTYGLGLAIPFVGSAVLFNWFLAGARHVRGHLGWIERGAGVVLIILGAMMVSGHFATLSAILADMGQLITLESS